MAADSQYRSRSGKDGLTTKEEEEERAGESGSLFNFKCGARDFSSCLHSKKFEMCLLVFAPHQASDLVEHYFDDVNRGMAMKSSFKGVVAGLIV